MAETNAVGLPIHELTAEDVTPERLGELFFNYQPETDLALELWPRLSWRARRSVFNRARIGDFDFGSELLLMYAVEEDVVVPQWVIDAGDTLAEHWGWSPNVEKACAALQARLDEHKHRGDRV